MCLKNIGKPTKLESQTQIDMSLMQKVEEVVQEEIQHSVKSKTAAELFDLAVLSYVTNAF